MKFTQYFLFTQERPDRKKIALEWIERTMKNPLKEEKQADGRIRKWSLVPESGNKYLRVVLLADGETVHNAFFDRDFGKPESGKEK